MPNAIAHFAVNADDVSRARSFYQNVFGWKFHAFGPPNFYMVEASSDTPPVELRGSLQGRRELVPGARMRGFECTIAVANIQATATAITANGGTIVMPICTLPNIGQLLFFQDTEGNIAGAMQYDPRAD